MVYFEFFEDGMMVYNFDWKFIVYKMISVVEYLVVRNELICIGNVVDIIKNISLCFDVICYEVV